MTDNESQGISRRDLLKKGAVLGGAVVWTTPVVQTMGMGRAFASTTSPVGPAISYIALIVTCADGDRHFLKWEVDGGQWEPDPGKDPGCETISSADYDHKGTAGHFDEWPTPTKVNDRCYTVTVPTGCSIIRGVTKGGTNDCHPIGASAGPTVNVGPGC